MPAEAVKEGRGPIRWLILAGCALAVLVVVPACSSSPAPDNVASTTSTAVATTTSAPSVTLPDQSPATLAACAADAQSVETALIAFMAEHGAYPSPPGPWTAATYAANYGPLTAPSGGGPFLHLAPGTRSYVIEYDAAGHVWIAPPGQYPATYNSGQDFGLNPNVCLAAVQ
jgi:hypothetical protein